jgi:hypothetical protein
MANLTAFGVGSVWAVIADKGGVESTLVVTIDGSGHYVLLGYT